MKKVIIRVILLLVILSCYFGIKEIWKGHTFYILKVNKDITLEFVHEYFWECSAGVFVIVHKTGHKAIRAPVDLVTLGYENMPQYGYIKSKEGIVGVFRKDRPDNIIFLFDPITLLHVPFICNKDYDQYQKEWDKMHIIAYKFFAEYPNLTGDRAVLPNEQTVPNQKKVAGP